MYTVKLIIIIIIICVKASAALGQKDPRTHTLGVYYSTWPQFQQRQSPIDSG